jgi:hypothetical protein
MTTSASSGRDTARHVEVADHGVPIGEAEVEAWPTCVCVSFHIDSGHVPAGTRPDLVDRVFALDEVQEQDELQATVPLGDYELLDALRQRCSSMQTRAAGSTCLVDGVLSHCDRCDASGHEAADIARYARDR